MDSLASLRRLFGAAALACYVTACGGASPSALPRGIPYGQSVPLGGGSFTAAYAGFYVSFGGTRFSFHGSGKASFLGVSTERGGITEICGPNCYSTGGFTFTSMRHTGNTITVGWSQGGSDFCHSTYNWQVHSGTGRFAHASGHGTLTFRCPQGNSYSDSWTGTVYF